MSPLRSNGVRKFWVKSKSAEKGGCPVWKKLELEVSAIRLPRVPRNLLAGDRWRRVIEVGGLFAAGDLTSQHDAAEFGVALEFTLGVDVGGDALMDAAPPDGIAGAAHKVRTRLHPGRGQRTAAGKIPQAGWFKPFQPNPRGANSPSTGSGSIRPDDGSRRWVGWARGFGRARRICSSTDSGKQGRSQGQGDSQA